MAERREIGRANLEEKKTMSPLTIQRSIRVALLTVGGFVIAACASDKHVDEPASVSESSTVVASGTFANADLSHRGSGTATIYRSDSGEHTLRLTDFQVTAGPDLKVYLVDNPDVRSSSDVSNAKTLSLGALKGNIGSQNYEIPAGVDPAAYKSIVIWCEAFGVLFSPARLQ